MFSSKSPLVAAVLTGMLAALISVLAPARSMADTAAPAGSPTNPVTASADALPTVQINGVAWTQVIVGQTVYVGGEFTSARPAGAPEGSQETGRANLLAYDVRTGELIAGWNPGANGPVYTLSASPDGSRIYVGGSFTELAKGTVRRLGAVDPVRGRLVTSFLPNPDAAVRSIVATSTTVFFGGTFGMIGPADERTRRTKVAAVAASDADPTSFAPYIGDTAASVDALALAPAGDRILLGGTFTAVNHSSHPGYGLASVTTGAGTSTTWAANSVVRNAGGKAGITSLRTVGNSVYSTGFSFGGHGTLEGAARMSWNGGALEWIEDCHGDSYGLAAQGQAIYVAAHTHYCGNLPTGYPETVPRSYLRLTAFSQAAADTLLPEYGSYHDFSGTTAPALLTWFPAMSKGTYTGQEQGAWTMAANADYVVAGGEFPRINRTDQYGLVRFARVGLAPNDVGTQQNGTFTNPTVHGAGRGQVVVSWRSNRDLDNARLTYQVVRDNDVSHPVATRTGDSSSGNRPYLSVLDSGVTPGAHVTYRLLTRDPFGNETRSAEVPVVVPSTGAVDAYAKAVLADGPWHYWRLAEASGSVAVDFTGLENATLTSGVSRGVGGAVDGNAAADFNGAQTMYLSQAGQPTSWYTVEAWVRTSTTSGGHLLGFGDERTGSSDQVDHVLYLDTTGRANLGSYDHTVVTGSARLNDGQWHYVAGTVDQSGMRLYVDGALVASRRLPRIGALFTGFWRVGGDYLGSYPNRPTRYLDGRLDEVAVYAHSLSAARIQEHYRAR